LRHVQRVGRAVQAGVLAQRDEDVQVFDAHGGQMDEWVWVFIRFLMNGGGGVLLQMKEML
jgi:hypothetical protein